MDIRQGALVSSSQTQPLVTISTMDPLFVEFTFTEKEFPKVPQNDLQIEITTLCSNEPCKTTAVTFMDNQFDQKTGLLLVRGKVSNPDYTLRPGQSVRVRIPIALNPHVKLIPQRAIRYNQQGPYIYVVQEDHTVAVRQLILGMEQGLDQIVLEGLDPSELVILDGHLRISPGIKVEIKS